MPHKFSIHRDNTVLPHDLVKPDIISNNISNICNTKNHLVPEISLFNYDLAYIVAES